jgi:hypothetical protein
MRLRTLTAPGGRHTFTSTRHDADAEREVRAQHRFSRDDNGRYFLTDR